MKELDARENELKAKKQSAVSEIRSSIAGNEYRIKQADEVTKIMETYSKKINDSNDIDAIEELKKKCIEELAEIKTAEEMNKEESKAAEEASKKAAEEASKKAAEEASRKEEERKAAEKSAQELENARSAAVEEIESYVDPDEHPAAKAKIQAIIGSAKATIMDERILTTVSAVESMVSSTKKQIDDCIAELETSEESSSAVSETTSSEETSED